VQVKGPVHDCWVQRLPQGSGVFNVSHEQRGVLAHTRGLDATSQLAVMGGLHTGRDRQGHKGFSSVAVWGCKQGTDPSGQCSIHAVSHTWRCACTNTAAAMARAKTTESGAAIAAARVALSSAPWLGRGGELEGDL
jgi:hypothetical protein